MLTFNAHSSEWLRFPTPREDPGVIGVISIKQEPIEFIIILFFYSNVMHKYGLFADRSSLHNTRHGDWRSKLALMRRVQLCGLTKPRKPF